jgi:hypothetical protein
MLGGATIIWIVIACLLAVNAIFSSNLFNLGWSNYPGPVWAGVLVGAAFATAIAIIGGLSLGVIGLCLRILAWTMR